MLYLLFLIVIFVGMAAYYGRDVLKTYFLKCFGPLLLKFLADYIKLEQPQELSVAREELGHLRVDYLYNGAQYTTYLARNRRAGRGSSTQLRMVKPDGEEISINHPQGYAFPHSPSQLGLASITRVSVLGQDKQQYVGDQQVM